MKIIDIHAHTGKWMFRSDADDDCIPSIMDRFNIEKAVFSSGLALMCDMVSGNEANYNFIKAYKGCYAYIVLNPNDLSGAELELKKYLGKEKIVGIKLHPIQFNHPVNSGKCKKLLQIINSYGLPILIHIEDAGVSHPSTVLEIAQEFPYNKYIIAHMGNSCWKEVLETAKKSGNIYTDIVSTGSVYDQISVACKSIGSDHVLYGSDMNLLNPALSIGMMLSSDISDDDREKILYKNALSIFKF